MEDAGVTEAPATPAAKPSKFAQLTPDELWALNRKVVIAKNYTAALKIWRFRAAQENRPAPADAPGVVSSFGERRIYGWLTDLSEGDEVELRLNDRVVYRTVAVQQRELDGELRDHVFRFTLAVVWLYLGADDKLEVTTPSGRRLAIRPFGTALEPWLKRASKVPELFKKLDAGYAFNKWGKLQKPLHTDLKYTDSVMSLFDAASDAIEKSTGRRPFVFYGTLLGAIRDRNFIAHDDDIDVIWLAGASTPKEVRAEFVALCRQLIADGFHLTVKPFGAKVRYPGAGYKKSFGLHYGWIDEDGALQVAYGHHGPLYHPPGGTIAMTTATLGRFKVAAPVDSEAILEMLYTRGWKVPDPGFSHHNGERVMHTRYHLSEGEMKTASRAAPSQPTPANAAN